MELPLDGSAHQNLPKDATDHAAAPPVLSVMSPQEYHRDPEPPKMYSSESYVTRSSR